MEHDLKVSEPIIIEMAKRNARLTTIYKYLRAQKRFIAFGNFPLISWIIRTICTIRKVDKSEIVKVLRNVVDGEFRHVQANSEIVIQLCA